MFGIPPAGAQICPGTLVDQHSVHVLGPRPRLPRLRGLFPNMISYSAAQRPVGAGKWSEYIFRFESGVPYGLNGTSDAPSGICISRCICFGRTRARCSWPRRLHECCPAAAWRYGWTSLARCVLHLLLMTPLWRRLVPIRAARMPLPPCSGGARACRSCACGSRAAPFRAMEPTPACQEKIALAVQLAEAPAPAQSQAGGRARVSELTVNRTGLVSGRHRRPQRWAAQEAAGKAVSWTLLEPQCVAIFAEVE